MTTEGQAQRIRLDQLLIDRGSARGRGEARSLIEDGRVSVNGIVVTKPGQAVTATATIDVEQPPEQYASRGGIKLAAALERFPMPVEGQVALDVGASTGGFTDVLLRRGAGRVYAVDVGYGQIAWTLRQDPRVCVMDRTNIRYLQELPEAPSIATIDVAFISLDLVLPPVQRLLAANGQVVCLIKPQFEVGKNLVGKGGVVRSTEAHAAVLKRVLTNAEADGWIVGGVMASPITGPAGNKEFLAWLHHDPVNPSTNLNEEIRRALSDTTSLPA
ncbi:MAG: hemolysin [Chloroflexi bacterium]|jgi:23S rRNA (cytidine1920-2'-O)/16S rRNA (cytidine1409-2'-O)-methyltransferase|nr:hemolysin [Chloroflexota bacterium]